MSRIFISYRRQDSPTMTGRIYDKLETVFGSNKVFRDIDDIAAGQDFRVKLANEIDNCDILLVIIGPKWESITDANGKRRLDDENDFVRLEVEAGLKRSDKIVIPVLVDNAPMPNPASLPESMRELCYRNAISIRQDPDFHRDTEKLIQEIRNSTKGKTPFYKKKEIFLATGVVLAILVMVFFVNSLISKQEPQPLETATVSPNPTDTITIQSSPTSPIPEVTVTATAIYTPTILVTDTSKPAHLIRIGIVQIPDYIFTDIPDRLRGFGYNAEWIGLSSDYAIFSEYDVIYLPIGWAFQNHLIENRAMQYQRFVEDGGGLIVEQPNYAGALSPELLPYEITFKTMRYDPDEWPPRIVSEHEIIKNISVSELPGPGSLISAWDDNWTVITNSSKSNSPTLLVTSYGNGRIAVLSTSVSKNSSVRYQVGDNFIKSLITWVSQ